MGLVVYEKGDWLNYPEPFVESKTKMQVIDRAIRVYPSGKWYIRYLYDGLLDILADEMHKNIEDHLDNVVCIYGSEGSGKSHLAYWLAKKYNPNFDMEKSYTYSFDDLLIKIHEFEDDKNAIFWLDEATNISNNRDWMRRDNKAFITMLEMFRSRGWTLILCIPDKDRLDVYLREQRVRYLLHADWLNWEEQPEIRRGYFGLFRVDTKTAGYRKEKFVGYGEFDVIPEDDEKIYNSIKQRTQDAKLNEMYEQKNQKSVREKASTAQRKMILHLSEERGMTLNEIAELTGLSYGTVANNLSKAKKERDNVENE